MPVRGGDSIVRGTLIRHDDRYVVAVPPLRSNRRGAGADSNVDRLWDGLSMYDAEARTRQKARRLPYPGGYLARVVISSGAAFRVDRTLSFPGHHTVWGDPSALLNCVAGVIPV
jgi:hypothetical protein